MSAWPQSADAAFPLAPRRWRLDYEVDFTAEATQTISGASVTIAGVTWTVANDTNADVFAVTNGTGLRIGPATNTQYSQATKDAPYIQVAFDQLMADYDRADRLFLLARFATVGLAADYQSYGMVVGGGMGTGNDAAMLENQYSTNALVRSSRLGGAEWNLDSGSAEAVFLGLELRPLYAATYYQVAGGAWPLPSALTQASKAYLLFNSGPLATPGWFANSAVKVRLFAERNNSAAAFTSVFEALRIYRQLQ